MFAEPILTRSLCILEPKGPPRVSLRNGVVPVPVEFMSFERHRSQLCVAHLDALLINVGVRNCLDGETFLGGRGRDQFDDRAIGDERSSTPVHRDEAEHLVLNFYLHLDSKEPVIKRALTS